MSQLRLALPLAITVAIAPFALDTYLPAFPDIASSLGTSVHQIALSVSVYIVALALGQLSGGPMADRFGRQPVMFVGLLIFALSSLAVSLVASLEWLLVWRVIQAFGGGWVIVCVPALVRDRTAGVETARLFSLIGMIMVAAPAIAPAVGSVLMTVGGWRSIFWFLAVYAVLAMIILKSSLFSEYPLWRKSSPLRSATTSAQQDEQPAANFLQRYRSVLRTKPALRFVFLQALVFAVMMVFVTHASYVYQTHFQVSARLFSLLFAANIVTMWTVMTTNRWLLGRFKPLQILRWGVTVQTLSVLAMLAAALLTDQLWLFVPTLMITVGAVGATSPNCQACYMEYFSQNGGTAAALMGATQFGLAGLISGISALLPESIASITVVQTVCALIALLLIWWPDETTRTR